jgi:hypothetical protein
MPVLTSPRPTWRRRLFTVLAVAFFLVPAGAGFINKFREFLVLAGDDEGSFTVMPILNYLLSSLGFCLLLFWAALHGMFSDVEKPKYAMLDSERMLDDIEQEKHCVDSSIRAR